MKGLKSGMETAENSRRRKILVVEPDVEFALVLQDFLLSQRFDVEIAHTGDDGIKKYGGFKPDIVLLSRELPVKDGTGPDGLRVLRVLNQNRKAVRVPVIMSSTEATDKDFERYRKLKFSADDYMTKPFEDTDLLRKVENLVGFDFSEGVENIKMDQAMEDSIHSIFDADEQELGLAASAQTRKEISWLLDQVGEELDRQNEVPEEPEKTPPPEQEPPPPDGQVNESQRLQDENKVLDKELDKVRKQLVSERKRSREIKKEWRTKLQEIEKRLAQSEKREQRMREEFEAVRGRFADLELEHTMEIERINSEKRRMEEELIALRHSGADLDSYPPERIATDLAKLSASIHKIIDKIKTETEDKEK